MALLGTVGPFDPAVDDWVVYCERLEQFFQANGVAAAEKQRAVLLSVCGNSTHRRIQDFWLGGDMNINEGWGMVNCKRNNRSTHTVTCIPACTVTCIELFLHGHMTRGL